MVTDDGILLEQQKLGALVQRRLKNGVGTDVLIAAVMGELAKLIACEPDPDQRTLAMTRVVKTLPIAVQTAAAAMDAAEQDKSSFRKVS